ncbi:hypothetical protein OG422_29165 [Streptomyces sp. NBC_01525]|uniref:hypothetical protein n=1 Tax=Streptomyces sp. NBC_01525 TaxID=2903893 RepID=UPI00386D49B4
MRRRRIERKELTGVPTSGSSLHEAIADQDVVVTPGATTRLTITDPFKAAEILLRAKDGKAGKLLPGATVNIGTGTTTLLTLTTGAKGTASGELPVSSRKTEFWLKQIKATTGYDLYKPTKMFTAEPGAPITVTVTNANTTTSPKPDTSDKPTHKPTGTPSTPADTRSSSGPGRTETSSTGAITPDGDSSSTPEAGPDDTTPQAPAGSLAHTGADATPWIAGGASFLVVGTVALIAARRRTSAGPERGDSSETS